MSFLIVNFSDCNSGERCFLEECFDIIDSFGEGSPCDYDFQCSGDLVCEKDGRSDGNGDYIGFCTLKSLRDGYHKLPCLQDNDCCSDNDYNYCCLWVTGKYGKKTDNTII